MMDTGTLQVNEILTGRFCIREFRDSDLESVQTYQSDPRYLQHYDSKPDAKRIISKAIAWSKESPRKNFQLAISLTSSSEAMGGIGIRTEGYTNNEAELGFELNPTYWGKGFARDAITHMLTFCTQQGFTKLHAITKTSNTRAINLIQSLGFGHYQTKRTDEFYALHL